MPWRGLTALELTGQVPALQPVEHGSWSLEFLYPPLPSSCEEGAPLEGMRMLEPVQSSLPRSSIVPLLFWWWGQPLLVCSPRARGP